MKYPLLVCLLLTCGMAATAQIPFLQSYNATDPGTEYWSCIGPFNSYYGTNYEAQGRVNAIWVDSADSNHILVGGDAGGLWKSADDGQNWTCLTDNVLNGGSKILGMLGVNWIAVNPFEKNIIYIGLGMTAQYEKSAYPGYGLGVAYTTDGGLHWCADTVLAGMINDDINCGYAGPVTKIAYAPGTQRLFAISNEYVFYKKDSSTAWEDISSEDWNPNPSILNNNLCRDLEFSTVTPGEAIISTYAFNDTGHLWLVPDPDVAAGDPWIDVPMLLPSPYHQSAGEGPLDFSMGANDTAYIRYKAHNGAGGVTLLMKTSINTVGLQVRDTSFAGNSTGFFTQFAVSPNNPKAIYMGHCSGNLYDGLYYSANGGSTFSNFYSGGHCDGRCVYIYHSDTNALNDVVYYGCDGGIRKKRAHQNYSTSITGNGLGITEFYGFGNSEADEDDAVAGAQDNGGFSYLKKRSTPWRDDWSSDDGCSSKMMRDNTSQPIGEIDHPLLIQWTLTDTTSAVPDTIIRHIDSTSAENRPIYYDKNDEAYIGYCHIFKQDPGSSAWSRAFPNGDPIDSGGIAFIKKAEDFYINENDNDTAYIAYESSTLDPNGNRHDPSIDTFGKLYFSSNSQSSSSFDPVHWANISPSITYYYQINSIAVDPNNNSRIWVGFGNANTGALGDSAYAANRVWYSDSAGAAGSWHDVSAGLPPLSVNKLLYRRGSDDEIYAGTETGVYLWNKSIGAWQSFNAGLPPCVVMDMELNYCAGKLRIATYGRGMWETAVPDVATPKPMLITASTVLSATALGNNNIYMQSSIDVQAGATLTLHGGDTLHMPKDAIISVEPGGRLVVDGGMITNDCEHCLWHGIQARGTCWQPQTPAYQGYVIIEGGSTIANARVGVANSDESVVWSTDGGVIQCSNSRFINNTICASFREYDNFTGEPLAPVLHPNISYFTNCSFLLDNDYKNYAGGPMK